MVGVFVGAFVEFVFVEFVVVLIGDLVGATVRVAFIVTLLDGVGTVAFAVDGACKGRPDVQLSYPRSKICAASLEHFPDSLQQQGRNSSGTSSRHGSQHALKGSGSGEPVLYPTDAHLPSSGNDGAKPSQHPQKSSGCPAFPFISTNVGKTDAAVQRSLLGIAPPPSK